MRGLVGRLFGRGVVVTRLDDVGLAALAPFLGVGAAYWVLEPERGVALLVDQRVVGLSYVQVAAGQVQVERHLRQLVLAGEVVQDRVGGVVSEVLHGVVPQEKVSGFGVRGEVLRLGVALF